MKALSLAASLLLIAGVAAAQDTQHTSVMNPGALIWSENPAFPKGIKIATLVGDPTKAGETVVQRIKFPPHFQMPPHTHPFSEVVTVIAGRIGTSSGSRAEKKGFVEAGIAMGIPGETRALRLDRKGGSDPASPVHRSRRH